MTAASSFTECLTAMILTSIECPLCHTPLTADAAGHTLRCGKEGKCHCFDVSSAGYVNLFCGRASGGDGKEAVRARTAFLEKDFYAPIADALCEVLRTYVPDVADATVVDAGCGDGYYLNRAVRTLGCRGLGFDLSKFAVEHAARTARRAVLAERTFYAVASVFGLPLADGCADALINLFAPCAEEEYARVLRRGGVLIVVGAGEDHLLELKQAVYDEVYRNDPRADLPMSLALVEQRRVDFTVDLDTAEDIAHLFSMTPYYYRTSPQGFARLHALTQLTTRAQADIFIYRKG